MPTGAVKGLASRSQVQALVAEATADLLSSQAFIRDVIGEAWQIAERGNRLPVESKARLRLAAANATARAVHAVDQLYQAGGGSPGTGDH